MREDWLDDDGGDEEFEEAIEEKYLSFRIGSDQFVVSILGVQEIIGVLKMTFVPDLPSFVLGVVNLRGQVVPVISMRRRFELEDRAFDERTCLVVVRKDELVLGLIVDEVSDVVQIKAEEIQTPHGLKSDSERRFIVGFAKTADSIKVVLDLDKMLKENEWQRLQAVS